MAFRRKRFKRRRGRGRGRRSRGLRKGLRDMRIGFRL